MNPPTAEAVRPADSIVQPPEEEQRPDIIAFFQNESGQRTPITKGCVEVVFVRDRSHFDHCIVTLDGEKTFVKPKSETLVHLLESDVPTAEVDDLSVDAVTSYARFMSKRHGQDPLPELIPVIPSSQNAFEIQA